MTYTFNLIDQPWLPCVKLDDTPDELSLRNLLANAHTLRAIHAETPLITCALLPLLLALLHRVFGPKNSAAWEKLYQSGAFPMPELEAYFEKWHERFDLFHPERPFYQAKDERVEPKSVIHLIHSVGNTGTLFTHMNEAQGMILTPPEAARHLITAQAFRTAGLSGLPEKFTDSVYTRGVLFWAQGETLFETLLLNLMPYPTEFVGIPYTAEDKPTWEQTNPFQKRVYPHGYLDYLTWQNNRVMLLPHEKDGQIVVETMTIAPGLHIAADVLSPQKYYTFVKKGEKTVKSLMYFSSEKALWRDYHTLVTPDNNQIKQKPRIINWLSELKDDEFSQIVANGMNSRSGQDKPIFYRQEYMPLPLQLLRAKRAPGLITNAIEQAESVSEILSQSLAILAQFILTRKEPPKEKNRIDKGTSAAIKELVKQWNMQAWYWMQLEPEFWNFVDQLAREVPDANTVWIDGLKRAARDALNQAAGMCGTSAWALRGQVAAERRMNIGFSKLVYPSTGG